MEGDSLDVIAGRTTNKEREYTEDSNDSNLSSLRLVRNRSNTSSFSGTGYLFLAIVFCMMCCSSLMMTPSNLMRKINSTM